MAQSTPLTAGIILIGNELLSGHTQDKNLSYIAGHLNTLGITLKEVVVVPDMEEEIVRVVRDYSQRFTYVFTTGGIGPTHDDITAGAIAKAFHRSLVLFPEIMETFEKKYEAPTPELKEARLRMASLPDGCTLIHNKLETAPGFQVENVFSMAGIPYIMHAMLETVLPRLERRPPPFIQSIVCEITEAKVATGLSLIQKGYPSVDIGSYPHWIDDHPDSLKIIVKGFDNAQVQKAALAIHALCLKFDPAALVAQSSH
jgi:molybdenum cofactor synthesis domain-containing protein